MENNAKFPNLKSKFDEMSRSEQILAALMLLFLFSEGREQMKAAAECETPEAAADKAVDFAKETFERMESEA